MSLEVYFLMLGGIDDSNVFFRSRSRGDRDRRDRDRDRRDERSDRDRRDDRRLDERENVISSTSNGNHTCNSNQITSSNPTASTPALGPPMEPSPGVWSIGLGWCNNPKVSPCLMLQRVC